MVVLVCGTVTKAGRVLFLLLCGLLHPEARFAMRVATNTRKLVPVVKRTLLAQ